MVRQLAEIALNMLNGGQIKVKQKISSEALEAHHFQKNYCLIDQ